MRNQVQLIAYVDRLGGGGLRELRELLSGPLAGLFGGVHLLPFFLPIDGADAGFDPIDHTRVDPRLGDWDDVRALSADLDLMADIIVNHVSSDSPPYRDFSARGRRSEFAGLFLTLEAVFPDGATEQDLLKIYRPRPGLPFTMTTLENGERRILWTTFTSKQVDIDVHHPQGRAYLDGILRTVAAANVRMVRLDAAGYAADLLDEIAGDDAGVVTGAAGDDVDRCGALQHLHRGRPESLRQQPPAGDALGQRLRHGTRLLVDLLEHVMGVVATLGGIRRQFRHVCRPLDLVARCVHDADAAPADACDVALFQDHEAPCHRQERRDIGCDEVLVLAEADDRGAARAREHDAIRILAPHDRERVGPA